MHGSEYTPPPPPLNVQPSHSRTRKTCVRFPSRQDAVSEYVALMKAEAGVDKVPVITVEEVPAKCLSANW